MAVFAALGTAAPSSAAPGRPPEAPLPAAPMGTAAGPGGSHLTDIHDIKPLLPLTSAVDPLTVALALAAVLLITGAAVYVIRRRRSAAGKTAMPPLPPQTVAMQQLAALRDLDRMDGRVFYFRLSAILRGYLQGRYGVKAVEMTTEELLPAIDPLGLPRNLAAALKTLLTSADPIKFAGTAAVKTQMQTDLGFAHKFVDDTTPAADTPDNAPTNINQIIYNSNK